jgi:F-type H+-transporting ATPase subunit beta
VQEILQRYHELADIIAILGMEELSEEDKVLSAEQGACKSFFLSRFRLQKSFPATRANSKC